jgi:hypothetical protein
VGQHGIRRKFYNYTSWHNTYHYKEEHENTETLALAFESPIDEDNYIVNLYKGWFIPPATTKYRFYMSCDDHCNLKLGSEPNKIEEPT